MKPMRKNGDRMDLQYLWWISTTTFWGGTQREDSYQTVPILSELGGWPCCPQWGGRWWRRAGGEKRKVMCVLYHMKGEACWGHPRCLNSLRLGSMNFYKLTLKPLFDCLLFLITVSGFCTWKYKPVLNQHPTLNTVSLLKCFSFPVSLHRHSSWLVQKVFRLQTSHFSKNTWNRLQKQVTACLLPLLHLHTFSWSSEKRNSGGFLFFLFYRKMGESRKHKLVEIAKEKERKGNKYLKKKKKKSWARLWTEWCQRLEKERE